MLLVEHDMDVCDVGVGSRRRDELWRKTAEGSREVKQDPRVIEAYLGVSLDDHFDAAGNWRAPHA